MTTALDQLSTIIPADIALANKALAASMMGITSVNELSLPQLARATGNIKSMYGLPLINAQTSAVPPAAAAGVLSAIATGTGQYDTLKIVDILGTAAGEVSAPALLSCAAVLPTMSADDLLACYVNMNRTIAGDYTHEIPAPIPPVPPDPPVPPEPSTYEVIIPSGPGAGTYGPYDTANEAINAAFGTGLIPDAQNLIVTTAAANPEQTAILNKDFEDIMAQLIMERNNQAKANLVFSQLTSNCIQATYSFVFSLPQYGQDSVVGGVNQFLQELTVMSSYGGQAIVGTLRQGQTNLDGTGINSNDHVPSPPNPPIPQAPLSDSSYPYP